MSPNNNLINAKQQTWLLVEKDRCLLVDAEEKIPYTDTSYKLFNSIALNAFVMMILYLRGRRWMAISPIRHVRNTVHTQEG